ncbi:noyl-CoA hydratase/3,2-trans-enoyl-CoA isomerase/3-hydroxyacyl-CoA dehydrogenase [Roseibium sp. TrichSKD4]|nr:noyl-CoA hydratase/3,2-trans-enoyl-CoA isomerase/3-hydroxyacyl-CoA dehydrogenase [Roseibium sp. TrichSKD4]
MSPQGLFILLFVIATHSQKVNQLRMICNCEKQIQTLSPKSTSSLDFSGPLAKTPGNSSGPQLSGFPLFPYADQEVLMTDTRAPIVTVETSNAIGLVAINNPPVNAASQAVRAGLVAAMDQLSVDTSVKVIAMYGVGRTFIAGADIREFGKPPQEPWLPDVCNRIEAMEKPVISVLHGNALGGGLEVALATHARIALPGLTIGFPEVTLGILPGAGGTQRAPRLAGIAASLDLITTGNRIEAEASHEIGLIDVIADGDPRDLAIKFAEQVLSGELETRRTGELTVTEDPDAIATVAETLKRKQPNLFSPHKCVEAVAASILPLSEGLQKERSLFFECMESPQRAGLIHAFFAERAVSKIPEAKETPRTIENIGVIGGGTMGSGIATACLLAGFQVILAERDEAGVERGVSIISGNLDGAVKRGKVTADQRDTILSNALSTTTDYAAFSDADLVIEAVFEDMDVKKSVFKQLDAICKDGAVLATNTSYLDVNEIAASTSRPEDVIGLHFFSPAHVMKLLEVVVADKTAPDVVATGFALGKRLRKIAVRAGVCDGFIGNRILNTYKKAADYLMMDGASPEEVDRAMVNYGFAMGPFTVGDLSGQDIGWAARKRQAPMRAQQERYVAIPDRLCEQEMFGRKTGKGYYVYGEGSPTLNPEAVAIIEDERAKAGITPRNFSEDEITARIMTAIIKEAISILEDGIALRPIDIDAVYLFGYGFPRFRGGPMHTADAIGAAELVKRIETYVQEDAFFWRVPNLLAETAQRGGKFAELNG